jgi:hypothetical protein
MHHQTDRTAGGPIVFDTFNVRDFDYYAAAYSIVSSVSTAGMNNVVCDIPARDEGEFAAFPAVAPTTDASMQFYQTWWQWVDDNLPTLRATTALPFPPGNGVVDGSVAIVNNTGWLMLFNPNAAAASSAAMQVGPALRLSCDAAASALFSFTEWWPVAGRVLQIAACGDSVAFGMEGRSAVVIAVAPYAPATPPPAALAFGPGHRAGLLAALSADGSELTVEGWAGAAGGLPDGNRVRVQLRPPLSAAASLKVVRVNGVPCRGAAPGGGAAPAAVDIDVQPDAATSFTHSQFVAGMEYDPLYTGGNLTGTVQVPAAVFAQLAARNATYPVPWTADDLAIAWLAPHRLLLYLDVNFTVGPGATIPAWLNGTPVPVLPVWSCRSLKSAQCFSGYWVDLTAAGVQPDVAYTLTITLPTGLPAGGFGGVVYDNVNTVDSAVARSCTWRPV